MTEIRAIPLWALLLSGCANVEPPSVTPDPAVAARVRTLSGNDPCSDAFAGVLTAYRIAPGRLSSFDLPPVSREHPGLPLLRQAWFKLSGGGSLVLGYDADQCLVTDITPRDGAVLPAIG
ncbi:hypothetical protein [Inquilinus limosus]|uniref:Lipoprotein n=1 Tax=Inquilinus limosus MP06 TaxID=1398085 RepID=A0A0A0D4D3_9PROT|nr:hypothetical protein [Inquilinus limosus]KGM32678.1 hypothetical protein P409_20005 [Inquilinus limosus MP06]